MVNFISSCIESMHESVNPTYLKKKEETKQILEWTGMTATAALVASVALGLLGFSLTLSGGWSVIVGVPLILVTLPGGYLAYNAYKVSDNFTSIIKNPKKYKNPFGLDKDHQLLKAKLKKGTIGMNWVINFVVDETYKTLK